MNDFQQAADLAEFFSQAYRVYHISQNIIKQIFITIKHIEKRYLQWDKSFLLEDNAFSFAFIW